MSTTTVNISSALKINVTPIESGASGGVLFQKSDGKLGQSSNFHWDDANSRLSIGQGTAPGARVDVRLPGVLSTDLGVRMRGSDNLFNIFEVKGNGAFLMKSNNVDSIIHINSTGNPSNFTGRSLIVNSIDTGGVSRPNNILINANDNTGTGGGGYDRILMNNSTDSPSQIQIGSSAVINSNMIRLNGGSDSIGFNNQIGTSRMAIGSNLRWPGGGTSLGMYAFGTSIPNGVVNGFANAFIFGINAIDIVIGGGKGNLGIGGFNPTGRAETNTLFVPNGTAPTSSVLNAFQLYSETGQARFRNADGSIIKLFRGAALTASDGTLANAVTRIAELEARLQANGLIA